MRKKEEMQLSNSNIDITIDKLDKFLQKKKVSSKEIIKIRLKVEETMRFYQKRNGEESFFSIEYYFGIDKKIILSFEGAKEEPFSSRNDEYIEEIFQIVGDVDCWQYKHKTNIVSFRIPKKPLSQLLQIGIALLCVAIFTLLFKFVFSDSFTKTIQDTIISPFVNTFISLLRSVACILIFTSIASGIVNLGNLKPFRKISKSLFSNLFLFMVLSVVVVLLAMIPWINFSLSNEGGRSDFLSEISQTIFNIIPTNPISPFIEGNAVQVIALSIFCGVILSLLGEKVNVLKQFLHQINVFISYTIKIINILLPFLIFAVVQNTILNNDISSILSHKLIILLWILAIFVQLILSMIFIPVYGKMSLNSYIKKAKRPLIITFLSSSSVASLPENMEACKQNFNINSKLVDIGIPIGQVLFMPCSAAVMVATCIGATYIAGGTVSTRWIINLIIISVVLAVAIPPSPGGAFMVYSLLFAQMGLSSEFFGVAFSLCFIMDNIVTTLNVVAMHYLLFKINKKIKATEKWFYER